MSVCVCARFVYAFESIEKPENPITQNAVRGLKRLQSATGSFFGFVAFTSFSPVSTCLLISAEVSGAHIAAEDEEESQGAWRRGSSKRRRRSIKTGKSNEKKNDEIEKSKKKKRIRKRGGKISNGLVGTVELNLPLSSQNARCRLLVLFDSKEPTHTHARGDICTYVHRKREREREREKEKKNSNQRVERVALVDNNGTETE